MSVKEVHELREEGGYLELLCIAKRFGKTLHYIDLDSNAKPFGATVQSLERATELLRENYTEDAAKALGGAGRELAKKYSKFKKTADLLGKNVPDEKTVEKILQKGSQEEAKKVLLRAYAEFNNLLPEKDTLPIQSATLVEIVERFTTLVKKTETSFQKTEIPELASDDLIVLYRGGGHYDRLVPPLIPK